MRYLIPLLFLCSGYSYAVQRVISLAPSSTELAYAAGLGDKLIAVSENSDYPQQAQKLERVAGYNSVNIERIIALNPDLILAWHSGGSAKALHQLKTLGFKLFYTDSDTLEQIVERIEALSAFADNPDSGKQLAASFRRRLNQLQSDYASRSKVSYFYQLSSSPLYTIAQQSWPSEVFSLCGGINIFADAPAPYPQVGFEQVLARAPEIIFSSAHAVQNMAQWQPWAAQLPAIANSHTWSLNADWINRPTPRSLKAVEEVCGYFDQVRAAQ
jgi:vitamin B12 transport system substrate-binding protein